jgi:hypothetical protein
LASENFMITAVRSTVPVYQLETLVQMMNLRQVKVHMSNQLEMAVEQFWRTHGIVGQMDYDPKVAEMLARHRIVLPFTFSGK